MNEDNTKNCKNSNQDPLQENNTCNSSTKSPQSLFVHTFS